MKVYLYNPAALRQPFKLTGSMVQIRQYGRVRHYFSTFGRHRTQFPGNADMLIVRNAEWAEMSTCVFPFVAPMLQAPPALAAHHLRTFGLDADMWFVHGRQTVAEREAVLRGLPAGRYLLVVDETVLSDVTRFGAPPADVVIDTTESRPEGARLAVRLACMSGSRKEKRFVFADMGDQSSSGGRVMRIHLC